jgi:translation initiation factor IF-2
VVKDEKTARQIAIARSAKQAGAGTEAAPELSLEQLFAQLESGQTQDLNIIVKADVQGSLDPIINSVQDLSTEQVKVNVIHKGTGNISESDIMLAIASRAIVIGFNVTADIAARRQAESENIEIRYYNIIYKIIDDVQKALTGMLEPTYQDVVTGHAEVRAVFRITRVGKIAGCYVTDGIIERNARARVLRNGQVLFDGTLSSLKRFQQDVREVRSNFECGIGIENFDDFEEADIIEAYKQERVV